MVTSPKIQAVLAKWPIELLPCNTIISEYHLLPVPLPRVQLSETQYFTIQQLPYLADIKLSISYVLF